MGQEVAGCWVVQALVLQRPHAYKVWMPERRWREASLVGTLQVNLSGMLPVVAALLSPDSALRKHTGSG